ncbi:MAG: thioredoxin domain-containing protein [Candidatus Eisenbacteria bacterium]|nr:thioredoxin domain-containing protein [Candidatus Eisenbacteria bacterium]
MSRRENTLPNRLARESSPYLQQHAGNPVDWWPWCEEAFERARREDRPVFLSIGYSACHWCHVMERESFADPETASALAGGFISVKVDREERPDLDGIYMEAVQAMTGSGGWPLSVFLTPEGKPFYGGTYFPPEERRGLPSFRAVLREVTRVWAERREDLEERASLLAEKLGRAPSLRIGGEPDLSIPDRAVRVLARSFDDRGGGFGGAPKFPQPATVDFLLRAYRRTEEPETLHMAERTLEAMALGGIRDHLGGGFHRYTVDADWRIPHFEKMLVDNALLARLYIDAHGLTGNPLYRRVAEETLDFLLREMSHPAGGFFSSLDADSGGEEGRFYLWSAGEIDRLLGGDDGAFFRGAYGVGEGGDVEGRSVLAVPRFGEREKRDCTGCETDGDRERRLALCRARLFQEREGRERPGRDEKIVAGWNGLALAAFAEAARAFDRPSYRDAAIRNARFTRRFLATGGRLRRSWRDGRTGPPALLEDYAFHIEGLLALYETTFDPGWFFAARETAEGLLDLFADPEGGGFFDTPRDGERLIVRPKSVQDGAAPSPNGAAARALLRLAAYTGDDRYAAPARRSLASVGDLASSHPLSFAHWLGSFEFALAPPKEVAIVGEPAGEDTRALLAVARRGYRPNQVTALGLPCERDHCVPLLENRAPINGRAAAYVCHDFACQRPVTDPDDLARLL